MFNYLLFPTNIMMVYAFLILLILLPFPQKSYIHFLRSSAHLLAAPWSSILLFSYLWPRGLKETDFTLNLRVGPDLSKPICISLITVIGSETGII